MKSIHKHRSISQKRVSYVMQRVERAKLLSATMCIQRMWRGVWRHKTLYQLIHKYMQGGGHTIERILAIQTNKEVDRAYENAEVRALFEPLFTRLYTMCGYRFKQQQLSSVDWFTAIQSYFLCLRPMRMTKDFGKKTAAMFESMWHMLERLDGVMKAVYIDRRSFAQVPFQLVYDFVPLVSRLVKIREEWLSSSEVASRSQIQNGIVNLEILKTDQVRKRNAIHANPTSVDSQLDYINRGVEIDYTDEGIATLETHMAREHGEASVTITRATISIWKLSGLPYSMVKFPSVLDYVNMEHPERVSVYALHHTVLVRPTLVITEQLTHLVRPAYMMRHLSDREALLTKVVHGLNQHPICFSAVVQSLLYIPDTIVYIGGVTVTFIRLVERMGLPNLFDSLAAARVNNRRIDWPLWKQTMHKIFEIFPNVVSTSEALRVEQDAVVRLMEDASRMPAEHPAVVRRCIEVAFQILDALRLIHYNDALRIARGMGVAHVVATQRMRFRQQLAANIISIEHTRTAIHSVMQSWLGRATMENTAMRLRACTAATVSRITAEALLSIITDYEGARIPEIFWYDSVSIDRIRYMCLALTREMATISSVDTALRRLPESAGIITALRAEFEKRPNKYAFSSEYAANTVEQVLKVNFGVRKYYVRSAVSKARQGFEHTHPYFHAAESRVKDTIQEAMFSDVTPDDMHAQFVRARAADDIALLRRIRMIGVRIFSQMVRDIIVKRMDELDRP